MPRESGRNDRRSHIAHLAARLMAEDGIEDYGLAKRKAARQAGTPDTRELPTNEEIDLALKVYQAIYHEGQIQTDGLCIGFCAVATRFNTTLIVL